MQDPEKLREIEALGQEEGRTRMMIFGRSRKENRDGTEPLCCRR